MPTALYLYNSQDDVSLSFFKRLKEALALAGWELRIDLNGALAGSEGIGLQKIVEQMREVEAIVYAIGPRGAGRVQGEFEAAQAVLAKIDVERLGRKLMLVPVLVGGAQWDQIPPVLQHVIVQADNESKGGSNELENALKAILGVSFQKILPLLERRAGASAPDPVEEHIARLIANRESGLTIFVSPYAVSDVHGRPSPGQLGRLFLEDKLPELGLAMDDLLVHPWVAAGVRALLDKGPGPAWSRIRSVVETKSNAPMALHERLAAIAGAWPEPPNVGQMAFKGLLLVTTDLDMSLETALWNARVKFGRIRFTQSEDSQGPVRAIYEEPKQDEPRLTFQEIHEEGIIHVETTSQRRSVQRYRHVMVLKLLGCISSKDPPPLSTQKILTAIKGMALPDQLPRHIRTASFLMLGGGLLHPLVSFALATYFMPNFGVPTGEDDAMRLVAMHSAPGAELDKLRQFEGKHLAANRVFGLERTTCDLLALLGGLNSALRNAPAIGGDRP